MSLRRYAGSCLIFAWCRSLQEIVFGHGNSDGETAMVETANQQPNTLITHIFGVDNTYTKRVTLHNENQQYKEQQTNSLIRLPWAFLLFLIWRWSHIYIPNRSQELKWLHVGPQIRGPRLSAGLPRSMIQGMLLFTSSIWLLAATSRSPEMIKWYWEPHPKQENGWKLEEWPKLTDEKMTISGPDILSDLVTFQTAPQNRSS